MRSTATVSKHYFYLSQEHIRETGTLVNESCSRPMLINDFAVFVFNFAGHDTTAHTLTFATFFLAANPDVQDWVSEEINHVMGDHRPEDRVYSDFPSQALPSCDV